MVDGRLELSFVGNDDRRKTFHTSSWPLPELHEPLVQGIAAATGFGGSCRTERSATNLWTYTRRFLKFLKTLKRPPERIADVTERHLRDYVKHASKTSAEGSTTPQQALRVLRIVFVNIPSKFRVTDDALSYLSRRRPKKQGASVDGLSDETFQRIITAARADVVDIRTRIRAGRALAARHADDPSTTPAEIRRVAEQLTELVRTGDLHAGPDESARESEMLRIASHIYPVNADITPMLILFAAVSGRNSETLKELPAAHANFKAGVVQLEVVKRRKGSGDWSEEIHWEVGNPSRQLHTPGGLFLLYDELFAPGRQWTASDKLWIVWTNPRRRAPIPNRYPWATSLQGPTLDLAGWAAKHGITEDGQPLELSFNRIRTTYLRRLTRKAGGHLPSAAILNSQDVLFRNYLSGDTATHAWAEEVVADTFEELEAYIRGERSTALGNIDGRLATMQPEEKPTEVGYLGCRDINHGPHNPGAPCGASALACFSCPNAVVGEQHLPRLLHLKFELEQRWATIDAMTWWSRYGSAWIAINEDIMPRFSPAELALIETDPSIRLAFLEDPA